MSGADARLPAAIRGRWRPAFAIAAACLVLAGGPAAAAKRNAARACSEELGPKVSASLVDQCRQVSLASRPPCNAENSCRLIRDEIHRSCALLGAEAPAFCAAHVDEEEDEEGEN